MMIAPRISMVQVITHGIKVIMDRDSAKELQRKDSSVRIKSLRNKGRSRADIKPSPVKILSAQEYMASLNA